MLESIHIDSYRTLRDTDVTFKDGLNIIIGMNGAGKSNLLEFISSHTAIWSLGVNFMIRRLSPLRSNFTLTFSYKESAEKTVAILLNYEKIRNHAAVEDVLDFQLTMTRFVNNEVTHNSLDVSNIQAKERIVFDREIRMAKPFLHAYITFNLPDHLRYLSEARSLEIDNDGFLVTAPDNGFRFLNGFEAELSGQFYDEEKDDFVLDVPFVTTFVFKQFEKVIREIRLNEHLNAYTNIEAVRLKEAINVYKKDTGFLVENLVLEFLLDGDWMPWSFLSDGTKRSFYLISEVADARNQLILIEEPEIGLHPFQLLKVMTFLKEQSATKQIVVTTHSPEVLNILGPEELDQILTASISKGITSFRRLKPEQQEKARMYMTEVGELRDYWLHSDMEGDD